MAPLHNRTMLDAGSRDEQPACAAAAKLSRAICALGRQVGRVVATLSATHEGELP